MRIASVVVAIICIESLTVPICASEQKVTNRGAQAHSVTASTPARLVPIAREIEHGQYSAITTKQGVVVTSRRQWKVIWNAHVANTITFDTQRPALPFVDFKTEMVVAIFLGAGSNGHYRGSITQITETRTNVIVSYIANRDSSGGGITTMAIAHPFHIVVTRRIDKPVLFLEVTGGIKP